MLSHSVSERTPMQGFRDSLFIEDLAECLYETVCQQHPDTIQPEWTRLSHSQKYHYRMEAAAAVARCDPEKKRVAQLRCREQIAQNSYRRDYSLLSTSEQNRINHEVKDTTNTYDRVLEGLFSPLTPSRRAELEPERNR